MKRRKQSKKPYAGTQAVLRSLFLLKALGSENPPHTLAELARKSGLNKTTAFRILTALESEGLVARDPNADTYTLGSELIVLGGQALRSNHLRAISRSELKSLARKTGETTTLEVLSKKEVLIIDEIMGDHLIGGTQSIGTRWPALATSTGRAILAHLHEEEVEEILKGSLPKMTDKTTTDRDQLRKELRKVRQQGYAVVEEEIELGFIAVGAPVLNQDGEPVAAISIGGPTLRISRQRIPDFGMWVKEASARISRQMGHR